MNRRSFLRVSAASSAALFIPGVGFVGCVSNDIDALSSPIDPEFVSPVDLPQELGGMYTEYWNGRQAYRPTDLDLAAWRLQLQQTVAGQVVRSADLTFDDVVAAGGAAAESFFQTFQCVGNQPGGYLIGNAYFTGAPLRLILERALDVDWATAARVVFRCFDGYHSNHKVARVTDDIPRPLYLAWAYNGVPLSQRRDGSLKHGYPLRIVCPEMMGMKSPKALVQIEVTDVDEVTGYWESRTVRGTNVTWADEPLVRVNSRIFDPVHYQLLPGDDSHRLRGTAWAGARAVAKVEIGVAVIRDGEEGEIEWTEARLEPPSAITDASRPLYDDSDGAAYNEALSRIAGSDLPVPFVWSRWELDWTPPVREGEVRIYARATDVDGGTQPAEEVGADTADGNHGMHSLIVQLA